MNIRARFEEIWPVPRGCMWTDDNGYLPIDQDADHLVDRCIELDARLDTFTRCQETMAAVEQRNTELVELLRMAWGPDSISAVDCRRIENACAKQIMEQKK